MRLNKENSGERLYKIFIYLVLGILAVLILLFFVLGIVLTVVGWKMTGKLEGLAIMLIGVVSLLTALFVCNAAYKN